MFLHVPFNIGIHMIIDVFYGRLTFASIFEKSLYIIMLPSEVYDQKSFLNELTYQIMQKTGGIVYILIYQRTHHLKTIIILSWLSSSIHLFVFPPIFCF